MVVMRLLAVLLRDADVGSSKLDFPDFVGGRPCSQATPTGTQVGAHRNSRSQRMPRRVPEQKS